jgi:L,D-peptidoglycan transpeptidase YkuD (ErfK/YbiS/YcfS/YnhG family)
MLIQVKNKDTLIFDNFKFKCCIGKNGSNSLKIEGDKSTPKGIFTLGLLYFRKDRCKKVITKIQKKTIHPKIGWCNDAKNKNYNKEIIVNNIIYHEKLYRKDNKYNYLLVINYNTKKIIKNKGSAIFLHLTNNYKPTAGCVALRKKDFEILLKLINKKTKIQIC